MKLTTALVEVALGFNEQIQSNQRQLDAERARQAQISRSAKPAGGDRMESIMRRKAEVWRSFARAPNSVRFSSMTNRRRFAT